MSVFAVFLVAIFAVFHCTAFGLYSKKQVILGGIFRKFVEFIIKTFGVVIMSKQDNLSRLCSEWELNVKQFRYSEWGNWYGLIKSYPAALLDSNGYLYLESPAALKIPGIKIGKRINVPKRISSLPGYVKMKQENNIVSQNVNYLNMKDVKYQDESLITNHSGKIIYRITK